MRKLLFFAIASVTVPAALTCQNISSARSMAIGATVTIKGVATNGAELGVIRYFLDGSGGLPAYGSTLSTVNKGDSVQITGKLKLFNNLLEIDPISSISVLGTNAKIPAPTTVTPGQLSETHEGSLVRVLNCKFSTSGSFATAATNYTVNSGTQTFVVRSNTLMSGTPIPSGTVNITGLLSQYCSSPTQGCANGYQLLVRNSSDFTAVVTGINEDEKNATVSVFPNPVKNELNIKLNVNEQLVSVKISDITGRVVYYQEGNGTTIQTSVFNKGIYTLIATTGVNTYRARFIKE